jgi:hypothetical protein
MTSCVAEPSGEPGAKMRRERGEKIRIYCHGMQIILLDLAEKPKCSSPTLLRRSGICHVRAARRPTWHGCSSSRVRVETAKAELQRLKPLGYRALYVVALVKATTHKDSRVLTQSLPRFSQGARLRSGSSALPREPFRRSFEEIAQREALGVSRGATAVSLPSRRK